MEINLEDYIDEIKEFIKENEHEFRDMFDECDCQNSDEDELDEEEIGEKAVHTYLENLSDECSNIKNEEIRNELIYFMNKKYKQNKHGFRGVVELINKFAK